MVVAACRLLLAVFSCLAVVFTVSVCLNSVPLLETQATDIQGQSEGDRTRGEHGRKLQETVASRVVGETQCLDCHRSEYARWKKSKHAAGAFDTLRTDKDARKYAEALGIKAADITAPNSLCVQCHATRQTLESGEARVLPAVSCEACHSASGGAAGWLNAHAVYGEQGSSRVAETEIHYLERKVKCDKAGQVRSEHLYQLAKTCYSCHIIGDEALVNDGGHKAATQNFEFATKSLGEVRHNFHLDQKVNAEAATLWVDPLWNGKGRTTAGHKRLMFVVGAMADLEVSLRYLAQVKDEDGDFFESMSDRVVDGYELLLEDVLEVVVEADAEDEADEENEDEAEDEDEDEDEEGLPLLAALLEELEEIYTRLDDEELVLEDDRTACVEAADAVATAAMKFVAKHNGNRLDALDEPEVPDDE